MLRILHLSTTPFGGRLHRGDNWGFVPLRPPSSFGLAPTGIISRLRLPPSGSQPPKSRTTRNSLRTLATADRGDPTAHESEDSNSPEFTTILDSALDGEDSPYVELSQIPSPPLTESTRTRSESDTTLRGWTPSQPSTPTTTRIGLEPNTLGLNTPQALPRVPGPNPQALLRPTTPMPHSPSRNRQLPPHLPTSTLPQRSASTPASTATSTATTAKTKSAPMTSQATVEEMHYARLSLPPNGAKFTGQESQKNGGEAAWRAELKTVFEGYPNMSGAQKLQLWRENVKRDTPAGNWKETKEAEVPNTISSWSDLEQALDVRCLSRTKAEKDAARAKKWYAHQFDESKLGTKVADVDGTEEQYHVVWVSEHIALAESMTTGEADKLQWTWQTIPAIIKELLPVKLSTYATVAALCNEIIALEQPQMDRQLRKEGAVDVVDDLKKRLEVLGKEWKDAGSNSPARPNLRAAQSAPARSQILFNPLPALPPANYPTFGAPAPAPGQRNAYNPRGANFSVPRTNPQAAYIPPQAMAAPTSRGRGEVFDNSATGRAAYASAMAVHNAAHGSRVVGLEVSFPLSPGTLPVNSKTCPWCGKGEHVADVCKAVEVLPEAEINWRRLARTAAHVEEQRATRNAAQSFQVEEVLGIGVEEAAQLEQAHIQAYGVPVDWEGLMESGNGVDQSD